MNLGRKRPPLLTSLSVQLPSKDIESPSQNAALLRSRRRHLRKESLETAFAPPKEEEEFLQQPEAADQNQVKCIQKSRTEIDIDSASSAKGFEIVNNHVIASISKKSADTAAADNRPPVIKAILNDDMNELSSRIEAGDNLEEEDETGFKPLHYACKLGRLEAIRLLVKAGCDPSATTESRLTSLHAAVRGGRDEAVNLLLQEGVVPDVREKRVGRTAVHEATLLPNTRILKAIIIKLQEDPWEARRILKILDKDGRTALHLASYGTMTEAIGLLLAAGADVAATDNEGLTPMHVSLLSHRGKRRCGGVLTLLLEAGGEVEVEGGSDNERLSHFAAKFGCGLCLEFLRNRGADLMAKNRLGRTPLHVASSEGNADAIRFLVSNSLDLNCADNSGNLPLHLAVLSDSDDVINALLEAEANPKALDKDGRSFVQIAILRRKMNAFQALVRAKAAPLPEEAGEDVLHYCSALGFIRAVSFLLEQGWDINLKDSKGRTALHRCLNHGHEDLATILINEEASLHEVDNTGATPLHYAVRWGGSDAILRLLVKKKARLGVRDRLGRTPLHYAASKFSIMSDLYILLGGGSALDSQDQMGLTPLHLAARLGNESLVRILLEKGAKHDIRDIDDFLPRDHAIEKGNKSIVKRLDTHHFSLHPEEAEKGKAPEQLEEVSARLSQHRKSVTW